MKLRLFLQTYAPLIAAAAMMVVKPFKFLHGLFPKRMRDMLGSWDMKMLSTFVFSGSKYAYIDQPCTMTNPPSYEPLIDAPEELRLTSDDISSFYTKGYIGPFTLFSPEEMKEIGERVMKEIEQSSKIYGNEEYQRFRDRHLDCESVYRLVTHEALTERLAQILGPDLTLWRSQVFLKPPGAPEVTWHQASTYLSEELYRATLYPPNRNKLFQLTTWLAFDDVDKENGYLQFIPGTQRSINKIRIGGKEGESFGEAKFKLDYDIDPEKVVGMNMRAGEFVVFTERMIHGSPPNRSNRRRWGMAFRAIQPDVRVYSPEDTMHSVAYLRQDFDLKDWGAIMIRGTDKVGVNKIIEPFPELRVTSGAA
ncbi:MAG: phytanoyl-CoA dioxygenase family protein [Acidobacteriota bacterium]|nr:phytanoyl-CoA dioxygenase family protein [Acidobacteriota bacterium]